MATSYGLDWQQPAGGLGTDAEGVHDLYRTAQEAIRQAFADGAQGGKQPGEWRGTDVHHQLTAAWDHVNDACSLLLSAGNAPGDYRDELRENAQHALARLAISLALLDKE